MSRARRRDRRVYLASHPVLFALLAATRRAPVLRLGRTVLVHGTRAYVDALTRVPLDRAADGTTGGAARRVDADDLLFDQDGAAHRTARRSLADALGGAGVDRLRPVWTGVLDRRFAPLSDGRPVDLVDVAAELAGATTAALLDVRADPHELAAAARDAAAVAVRDHLPGRRTGSGRSGGPSRGPARRAADRLTALVGADGLAGMLAVAAVNTTVAAIPRAVAWCADDRLWAAAADPVRRPDLVTELLRLTAPSPLLPRAAAGPGVIGAPEPAPGTAPDGTPDGGPGGDRGADGHPVRPGDRLILVARHAAGAHRTGPQPARVARLVFGVGPHACPGAALARAQLADVLAALAPYRPVVVTARADRRAALPGWKTLRVRPS